MKRPSICVLALASVVMLATGCGSNDNDNVAESASEAARDATTTTSATSTNTSTTTTTTTKETRSSSSTGISTTSVGPLPSGKKLTAGDFSDKQGEWKDGNYNVADQSGITGFSVDLEACKVPQGAGFGQGGPYYPAVLRFNLGHRYTTLKFKVGQQNESKDIGQAVLIRSTDGEKQFGDITRVGFDEVSDVEVDVKDKNVIFLQFYLDEGVKSCGNDPVTAVVYDAVLE